MKIKNTKLMNKMASAYNKTRFVVKKHSPEILIVAGVVGTVTSAVMACKATTKVSAILEDSKNTIETIHAVLEKPEVQEFYKEKTGVEYTEEMGKKDLTIVYAKTAWNLVKLYAPAVGLGTLSLGCIIKSNNILRKRNVALAAAYATVDKGFKDYRHRVVERFGEEVDKQLKYNIKAMEVEETVVDENGKETKVKKTIETVGSTDNCDYARFFDPANPYWEKDASYNMLFLRAQQQYANDLLRSKKYLFLNDVYEMLGFPRSVAGQTVGWIYNPDDPNHEGDSYVDFRILELAKNDARSFSDDPNCYDRTILVDFNVDGPILNKIGLETI